MMKVVYLFAFLVFGSCCRPSETLVIEKEVEYPVPHHVEVKELLNIDKMMVLDSNLVVINRGVDSIFCVYGTGDFNCKARFGRAGHGPTDFLFPSFLKKNSSLSSVIDVFDVNMASFKEIALDKVSTNDSSAIKSKAMPALLVGSPNLHLRDDSCFVGNIDGGQGLYFMYRDGDKKLEWVNFPNALQSIKTGFTIMNMNRITMNFRTGVIVSAMGYYNLLFLYDDGGRLKKTVQVGKDKISPKVVDGHYLSDECFIFCRDIVSTDKSIYMLAQNVKEKDFDRMDNAPSRVIVFDWNLNYQKTYQLPHYSLSFCLDELHNRIIYTTFDKEGGSDIYYISL